MNATKFTFDTVFTGSGDIASEKARARQRRTLTEAEIDVIRAEARAEGMKAGEVRALEALEAAAREIVRSVDDAMVKTARYAEVLRVQSAEIAFAVARKVARAAIASFPSEEVESALREAMHQAVGEPRILLRAAPAVVDALSPRIAEIAHDEGFDGRVQISSDATIKGADCRVEWRGGGAERAEAAIETALDELIARHLKDAGAQPKAEE